MPSKARKLDRAVAKLPSIPKELVDQFLTGPMTEEAINAAGFAFKQALIEAALNAELSHHLGYLPGAEKPEASSNHRNGVTSKTVLTGDGRLRIDGAFVGEVRTDGVLVIGEGAQVHADVVVGALIVKGGTLRGNVQARDSIELLVPAHVAGNLRAPEISIERGVQFSGECTIEPR